jgi:hypothetical protein
MYIVWYWKFFKQKPDMCEKKEGGRKHATGLDRCNKPSRYKARLPSALLRRSDGLTIFTVLL